MADIFVSYARADRARVAPLVAALECQGWSIWWDPAITPGQEFNDLIAQEIDNAQAVVVVWTPASVASRWVRGEAQLGAERGVLVPVRFDKARLPIDALSLHTTDLDAWNEDQASASFQELLGALSRLLKNAAKITPGRTGHRISVCVLPFVNMSDDREQEYFSDGISEDIITDLSNVSALLVIARNTAFTFKGRAVDVPQVAQQLKVSHVLEGSVRKSGNRVRITAQLIDGTTGGHVWAQRYDRNLDDIFALQDEISEAIVSALKLKLLPEEKKTIETRGTSNVEAYDLFLRARALLNQWSVENLRRGAALCRQAIALDPGFTQAYQLLVRALQEYAIAAPEHREAARAEVGAVNQRILALIRSKEAQELLVRLDRLIGLRKFLEAEQLADSLAGDPIFHTALPRYGDAGFGFADIESRFRTIFGDRVGRYGEFLEIVRQRAKEVPAAAGQSVSLQWVLDIIGRPAEAQAEYERTRDLEDSLQSGPELLTTLRMWNRAAPDAIKAQWARLAASFRTERPIPVLDQLLPVLFDPPAARALVRAAFDDQLYQHSERMMVLCQLAAMFGDTDLALAAMRRAYVEMRPPLMLSLWERSLADVRKDARFKDILRDLGMVEYWQKSGKWGDFVRPLGNGDFEITQ